MALPKFFQKFNNKHFLSLAGNVIMSGLSLVIMGILYRRLPAAEMGNWIFFQTIFVLVDMFRTGFLTTAFIKFYSGTDQAKGDEVLGSTWATATYITLALIVFNIPAFILSTIWHTEGGLFFFLKWFGVCYLCSLPMFVANCLLQAEARFDRLLYMRMVNQFSFLLFIVVLIAVKKLDLETLVYAYLLSLLLTSLFVLLKGWTRLYTWKNRSKSGMLQLYNFGKFSVLGNISSYLLRASDVFIIKGMLGAEAVAVYNIGLKLLEVIEIPLRSFIATAMQSLSSLYNRGLKGDMMYVLKKYAGLLTIALIPVCIGSVLFTDFAVYLAAGDKYRGTELANQAVSVIRLFMTFSLLFPTDRFIALGLDVIHKPDVNFMKILVMLVVNVAADFGAIAIWGNVNGVALATVLPVIVGIWIGYLSLRKYENFTLAQIPAVGYNEMKIFFHEKLNFRKSPLP